MAAFIISSDYRQNAEARLNDVLTANVFNLMGTVEVGSKGEVMGVPNLGDARYSLFNSGWYWSVQNVQDQEIRLASSSLADRAIEVPEGVEFDATFQRSFEIMDQNGQILQGLEAQVFLGEGNNLFSFRITANQSVLEEEITRFTQRLAIILTLMAFSIVAAMYIVIRLALRPIDEATQNLTEIRNGNADQITGDYPEEIQPLIDETNALIKSNSTIVDRARTQVGNLAHSLKTPLAVMQNEIKSLPEAKKSLLQENTDTMRKQVQLYLDRARISARRSTSISSTPILPVLEKLALVIAKLNRNVDIGADIDALQKIQFAGEEPDLQEIFGNLLENAAKYATSTIDVNATYTNGIITVNVEDDGEGMTQSQIELAQKRGGRVDEGKTGWGLGLSIVHDIVDEYGGEFELGRSELGGLKATIRLPGHQKP